MKQLKVTLIVLATVTIASIAGYFIFTPKNYTITYNTVYEVQNDNPTSFNKKEEITLAPLSNTEWYTFTGWYLDAECTQKTTAVNTQLKEDVTLYAGWQLTNYTATYKVNGETVHTQAFNAENKTWQAPSLPTVQKGYTVKWEEFTLSPADITVNAVFAPITYNIEYTGVIGATNPNPTTYTIEDESIVLQDAQSDYYDFLGWFVENRKVTTLPTDTVSDIIVEAKWQPKTFVIEYLNLKGADASNLPTSYTVESASITLPNISVDYYTFNGWTDQNGNPITTISTGSHGSLTLSASFTPIEYKITYNNTKGIDLSNYPTSYNVESKFYLDSPEIDHYTFNGWFNDEGEKIHLVVNLHGDLNLTAKFTPKTYFINYIDNISSRLNPTTYTVDDAPIVLKNDSRSYYNFLGWYDGNNNRVYEIDTAKGGNLLLYAKWEAISFNITYSNTMGVNISELPTSYTVEQSVALPNIARKYYKFLGWYNSEDRSIGYTSTTNPTNLTLTAKWEAIEYTITYKDLNNIEIDKTNLTYKYTTESEDIVLPIPTKNGYHFKGWLDDFGTIIKKIPSGSGGNITFTPYFTPVIYTITYLNAEDYNLTNHPITYTVEKQLVIRSISREHYTFDGWFDQSGRKIENTGGCYENLVLYPKWTPVTYTIEYLLVPSAIMKDYPSEYTIESPEFTLPVYEKEHYEFYGWLTQTGKNIIQTVKTGSFGNLKLTPQYTLIKYPINYHNLKDSPLSSLPQNYTYETELFYIPTATSVCNDFIGWYDSEGNEVKYVSKNSSGEINLYAKWSPIDYTITYSSPFELDTASFVKEYNCETPEIGLVPLEVDYYDFIGWFNEDDVKLESIKTGSYGNLNLTARFTPTKYNISYVIDGQPTLENPTTYTIEDEFTFNFPTKHGHTFNGWIDQNGSKLTAITKGSYGDLKLTPSWSLTVYTITYYNTHGADLSDLAQCYTIESEEIYLANVQHKGFTFNGWANERGENITVVETQNGGNINLYAKWTPNKYVITLNSLYGELTETQVTVSYKESYTLPTLSCEGKTFMGWFSNTGESGERYTDENGNSVEGYPIYVNRMLFARWETVLCNITYHLGDDSDPQTLTVPYGETFKEDTIPTKDNATFVGWYTPDFSQKYTNSTIIKANVDVYAKWITAIPISTASEFLAIANNPSGNYYLTQDIVLEGAVLNPIDTFSGMLDGMGYKIKDFMINNTSTSGNFAFISTNKGTIQNIIFSDFTFNATATNAVNMGIITGVNEGNIYNCILEKGVIKMAYYTIGVHSVTSSFGCFAGINYGNIIGSESYIDYAVNIHNEFTHPAATNHHLYSYFNVGGFVGMNYGTLSKCSYRNSKVNYYTYTYGKYERHIHSLVYAGGLIGENNGLCSENYTALEVTAYTANANTDRSFSELSIGGLVGYNRSGNVIYCYASGSVAGGYANSTVVGGLISYNSANLANSYSSCAVSCNLHGATVGGFVGHNEKSIQNCYSLGSVTSSTPTVIGGFVGFNTSTGSTQKCFTSATVNTVAGSTCGHFAGKTEGVTFKCYFDLDSPMIVSGSYSSNTSEHNNVLGISYKELWSEEFLIDTMYWDNQGWIFLLTEPPILEWETAIDHYYEATIIEPTCTEFGYTVYHCADCNRFFIKDVIFSDGHEFMEIEEVPATCEASGSILSYCVRCDTWITTQILEATGHTLTALVEEKTPTCTENGYEIRYCADCKQNVSIPILATGHTPVRTPPIIQNCEEAGYTEQISCADCDEILEERKEIAPHFYNVTVTSSATCTETGLCNRICTVCFIEEYDVTIPALGHTDLNEDYLCDVCGDLFGKYNEKAVVEINSVEGMLAINNNLRGIYRLTKNIQLPGDWAPLGNSELPFGGYFDGNGYTISFTGTSYSTTAGVFGYNTGIITNLTVSGLNVIAQDSITGANSSITFVFGGITAYNAGYVVNCNATGNNSLYVYASIESNKYDKSNLLLNATYGDLVGINLAGGVISNCSSNSEIIITVENSVVCNVKWQLNALLGSLGPSLHKNTLLESIITTVFGGIVGENRGECSNCSTTAQYTVNANRYNLSVANKYGYATAKTIYYHGGITGTNNGIISDCYIASNQRFNTSDKNSSYLKDSHFYAKSFYYYVALNNVTNIE